MYTQGIIVKNKINIMILNIQLFNFVHGRYYNKFQTNDNFLLMVY